MSEAPKLSEKLLGRKVGPNDKYEQSWTYLFGDCQWGVVMAVWVDPANGLMLNIACAHRCLGSLPALNVVLLSMDDLS